MRININRQKWHFRTEFWVKTSRHPQAAGSGPFFLETSPRRRAGVHDVRWIWMSSLGWAFVSTRTPDNLIPFTFHVFPMFCLMLWDSFVLQIRIFGISGFHVAPALPETWRNNEQSETAVADLPWQIWKQHEVDMKQPFSRSICDLVEERFRIINCHGCLVAIDGHRQPLQGIKVLSGEAL